MLSLQSFPFFFFLQLLSFFVVADTVDKEEMVRVVVVVGAEVGTSIGTFVKASVREFIGTIVVGVSVGIFV